MVWPTCSIIKVSTSPKAKGGGCLSNCEGGPPLKNHALCFSRGEAPVVQFQNATPATLDGLHTSRPT